jgi:hypothetical protein
MEGTSAAKAAWTSCHSIAAPKALRHPKTRNFLRLANLELRQNGSTPSVLKAATHPNDPKVLLEVSEYLQGAMKGLAVAGMDEASVLQRRGW